MERNKIFTEVEVFLVYNNTLFHCKGESGINFALKILWYETNVYTFQLVL